MVEYKSLYAWFRGYPRDANKKTWQIKWFILIIYQVKSGWQTNNKKIKVIPRTP